MPHRKMKVCLVGEAAVGKTALIRRFVLDQFDDAYAQTLGTKVYKHALTIAPGRVPTAVDMMIWDIMGQKGFRELLKDAYFHGARGILAVADATRRETLADLAGWIEGVRQVAGAVPVALLANKWDLRDRVRVSEAEVASVATAYGAPYHLASAKTGENVEAAFRGLAERITLGPVPGAGDGA